MNEIPFRSIAEMRISSEVLAKQGQWDDFQKCFRTKERQLQERARLFQNLHQALQFSTAEAFEFQKVNTSARYPMCLQDRLSEQNSAGIQEDPNYDEIQRRQHVSQQSRVHHDKTKPSHLRELEDQLNVLIPTEKKKEMGPAAKRQSIAPSSLVAVSTSPAKKSYSSSLMELKCTRKEVEEAARHISPVATVLGLSASPHLKSAITKMFANPDKADLISKQEYDRREKEFEEERAKAARHQQSKLQEERLMVEREMSAMKY